MTLNPSPTHYSSSSTFFNIKSRFRFRFPSSPAPYLNYYYPTTPPPPHKTRWARMDHSSSGPPSTSTPPPQPKKLLVIMGATGAGKSRLSIDLAAFFPPSTFEIINSDKMQVYKGLDITTNKIPLPERLGVPHHLLGELNPLDGELSPADFRRRAGHVISDITSRGKVPMLVGGSNTLIHALLVQRFVPGINVFDSDHVLSSSSSELRYNCCFLWVDVSFAVLSEYLSKRVDEMLGSGMYEELSEFFASDENESAAPRRGLRKAIGPPEFSRYFRKYPPGSCVCSDNDDDDQTRRRAYKEAVDSIKENTCQLAKKQIGKIQRLRREARWNLRRLEATEAFRAVVTSDNDGERWSDIWERHVVEPSVEIVKRFLEKE